MNSRMTCAAGRSCPWQVSKNSSRRAFSTRMRSPESLPDMAGSVPNGCTERKCYRFLEPAQAPCASGSRGRWIGYARASRLDHSTIPLRRTPNVCYKQELTLSPELLNGRKVPTSFRQHSTRVGRYVLAGRRLLQTKSDTRFKFREVARRHLKDSTRQGVENRRKKAQAAFRISGPAAISGDERAFGTLAEPLLHKAKGA